MCLQYKTKLMVALVAGSLLAAGSATADVTITVNNASGSVGSTVNVTWDYSSQVADNTAGYQFNLEYDASALDVTDTSMCDMNADVENDFTTCNEPDNDGSGTDNVGLLFASTDGDPYSSTNIADWGQVTFEILQPGTHTLTFTNASASDNAAGAVAISGNDATITGSIVGDAGFSSSPAPGSMLDLGFSVVGDPSNGPQVITVSEIGDQALDVTALTFTGPNASAFSTTTAPFMIPDGDPPVDVDVNCTPDARGNLTGTLELTNNSVNDPNPQYDLECVGLAPNVQVPAGPVAINGLTVDPNPLQATFDVTNPEDGFTSDAMNVTASAAGDAEISVEPLGPLTIATDDSQTFTVSCDNANAGSFSSTITIEWDDPVSGGTASDTIDATCDVSSAVASFDSDPGAPGPLAFGTVTNGTTSDPLGIDVINDGVGPSPDSDLTITGVSTDDAQFDAAIINAGPFVVGDPADGTDDIEVTCTPDAGAGAISGTLTVEHNGDDSPTLFDLTCSGESDGAFSSTPEPGGVLNLGVVPPTITTPEGFIDFTNNGSVDDITVSCTVTDDAGVFAFQPDPIDFTIAPGATESAGFECTPPDPISFQAEVSCTIGGDPDIQSADYTVVCQGEPLVVPTMNRWGLVLMSLMLLLVAGFAGRRMMA